MGGWGGGGDLRVGVGGCDCGLLDKDERLLRPGGRTLFCLVPLTDRAVLITEAEGEKQLRICNQKAPNFALETSGNPFLRLPHQQVSHAPSVPIQLQMSAHRLKLVALPLVQPELNG